jgi:phosphatidylglycerophosphate synthase
VNLAALPNILTFTRIFAVPLVVMLFYWSHPWANPLAAVVFIAAAVTDSLDGYLARKYGLTTPMGELKTIVQMTGLSMMMFRRDLFGMPVYEVGVVLIVVAAALTLWSMVSYLQAAWPELRRSRVT